MYFMHQYIRKVDNYSSMVPTEQCVLYLYDRFNARKFYGNLKFGTIIINNISTAENPMKKIIL